MIDAIFPTNNIYEVDMKTLEPIKNDTTFFSFKINLFIQKNLEPLLRNKKHLKINKRSRRRD